MERAVVTGQIPLDARGSRRLHWTAPLLIVLLSVAVLLPASPLLYPTPFTDTSIFMYVGNKINQGLLPFRDVFDHKPPLIFYLNALGLWLGGGYRDGAGRWGLWAVQILSLAGAGLLGFAFLRRYFRKMAAFLAIAAMLVSFCFVHERGNLTEEYALPFQFAALFLLSGMEQARKRGLLAFALGVVLAMASTLKQPLAGAALAVAVVLFMQSASRRAWRSLFITYGWIVLGALVVWAGWFLYFSFAGALPEFWEAAFAYNFAVSGISLERRLLALREGLGWLINFSGYYLAGLLAWLAAVAYLTLNRGWRSRWFVPLAVAVIDLPVELVLSSLSGDNFFHYFMPLLPALTVLTAFWVDSLWQYALGTVGRTAAAACLFAFFVPVLLPGGAMTAEIMGPRGDQQQEDIAHYIQETTPPDTPILVWGNAAGLYLLTGRESPSRYFVLNPLFQPGYSGEELSAEFLGDLQARPPGAIIHQKDIHVPFIMPAGGENCDVVRDPMVYDRAVRANLSPDEYLPLPDGMDDVYFWICQNYSLEASVGELGWDIYRWKGNHGQ